MAQGNSEGRVYLTALKRSDATGSADATVPAQTRPDGHASSSGRSGSQQPYRGVEKRRSSRYKCYGSAEMREENGDAATWACFTDISLHGCYVEATTTYPLGTILDMKLEADGVRIESKGEVRVTYPYLGMGIAFVEMTEENRRQLRQLLGVVSNPASIATSGLVSPPPTASPLGGIPPISDAGAALQLLTNFFADRHLLRRVDFVEILRKSQVAPK